MRDPAAQKTSDDLQVEIAHTRAELDSTLDQIGRRLSPHEVKERAVEYVKSSAEQIGNSVQRNPLPIAVAGTVLMTTAIARRRARKRRARLDEEQFRAVWERIAAALESRARTRRRPNLLPSELPNASQLAHEMRDGLAHALDEAAAHTQHLGAVAGKGAQRVIASLEKSSRDQPLLALAAAAAAGALLFTILRR